MRGMLHSNDLATSVERDARDLSEADRIAAAEGRPGRGLVRQMLRFNPDTTLDEALRAMQRRRIHLAVVADAAGRTLGVLALDDLLRRLIGDPAAPSAETAR